MEPDHLTTYETVDGWTNNLRHYPGDGPTVVLVHGMAATHRNWDFRPEVSLAAYLHDRGYDVWVPELRGDPGSHHPSKTAARAYTFDDIAHHDVPAFVSQILEFTGEDQLFWVGHSMGGMLLYTALTQDPSRIAAGVAISSPVSFEHPIGTHKMIRPLGFLLHGNGRLTSPHLGKIGVTLGLGKLAESIVSTKDSMRREMLHGLAHHVLWTLPKPMAHQAIQWIRSHDLATLDGEPWVEPADTPMLVMAGPKDHIISEPDAAKACDVYTDCDYIQLSEAGGFSHDYGHIDPVLGRMAQIEVYPIVLQFLERQQAQPPGEGSVPRLQAAIPDTDVSASR
jgi:pimeloyl-ACP methyl ester carboxylesterase